MVWGGFDVMFTMNCAMAAQGDYLSTVLISSFSVLSATRIINLHAFFSCLKGVAMAVIVHKIRVLNHAFISSRTVF